MSDLRMPKGRAIRDTIRIFKLLWKIFRFPKYLGLKVTWTEIILLVLVTVIIGCYVSQKTGGIFHFKKAEAYVVEIFYR